MAERVIETDRLSLRPLAPDDVDLVHRFWTDPDVRRYLWDDEVIDRDRAAAVVAESVASFARRGFGHWAMHLRERGAFVGWCGLRDAGDDVELLYAVVPDAWGRGLATEAARALVSYGFDACRLDRVVAATDAPNVASARVLAKAGFVRTPDAGGLLRFVVLRTAGQT